MKRILFLLALLAVVPGIVRATDYYVSTGGSDSNPGTSGSPWRTIQHAANVMVAGDTAYVRGGEYHECIDVTRSGSSGKPITYMAYPGEHPILDGTGVTCTAWHGTIFANGPDYITIDGFEIRDTNDYAIRSAYGSHWIIQNCNIHDVGLVVGHRNGVHIDDATDLLFRNNEIYHATWNGFSAERCDRCVLEGNYAHDNEHHYGMQIFGDSYEPLPEEPFFHDNIVRNNIIARNAAGLYFRNNVNLTISGNVIYNNDANEGYSGIHFGEGAGCSGSFNSNSKIYGNTIVGQKVSIYNEAFNYLDIRNNIFYNPTNAIFNFASDASAGHTIDYNLYYGKSYSGKGTHGFYADPLFVDSSSYDYSLQADSPACGAGEGGVDIGAFPCGGEPITGCGNSACDGAESCKSCPDDCYPCEYPAASLTNSMTMTASSDNFAANRAVENLWDGCLSTADDDCTAGAGDISSFWVEFDLGQEYDLTQARLFGDTQGTWVSRNWTLQHRLDPADAWAAAFSGVDAFMDGWSEQGLAVTARYVRVEVFSGTGATQARELELYGTPSKPVSGNLASNSTMASNSGNFRSDHPVEHLWDGCLENTPECSTGAGDVSLIWVEFDLVNEYDLDSAGLFGDTDGVWVSTNWTLLYRTDAGDPWITSFSGADAFMDEWSNQSLGVRARHVRVEVFSDTGATQARELVILGALHYHRADASGDGCVDSGELTDFIGHWYLDSTEYPMGELMEAVGLWKAGC